MAILPPPLYNRCRELFAQCSQFRSDERLYHVFQGSEFEDYARFLDQASSIPSRVDMCIEALKKKSNGQRPILALLALELAKHFPTGDDTRTNLEQLAQEIFQANNPEASSALQSPTPLNKQRVRSPAGQTNRRKISSIDVGIIIALREEFSELFEEARNTFQAIQDKDTKDYSYHFQVSGTNPATFYQGVVVFTGEPGTGNAALATERLLNQWKPRTLVISGLAASLDSDVQLGDIVIANVVDMYLENVKATPGPQGFEFQRASETYRSSQDILNEIKNFRFAHETKYLEWQEHCAQELQVLLPTSAKSKGIARLLGEQPEEHIGHIASGPIVSASEAFKEWVMGQDRKYLALEMESGGFMQAIQGHPGMKSLVLRAISDGGNEGKKELDKIGRGLIRRYAMRNAIRLLWSFFQAGIFPH